VRSHFSLDELDYFIDVALDCLRTWICSAFHCEGFDGLRGLGVVRVLAVLFSADTSDFWELEV
jgi:hypothetical protein